MTFDKEIIKILSCFLFKIPIERKWLSHFLRKNGSFQGDNSGLVSFTDIGRHYSVKIPQPRSGSLLLSTRESANKYTCTTMRYATQLLENQTPAQASWPVVLVTVSLSTLLSMMFLTLFLSTVELSVAHQFAHVFTKRFKTFIRFII